MHDLRRRARDGHLILSSLLPQLLSLYVGKGWIYWYDGLATCLVPLSISSVSSVNDRYTLSDILSVSSTESQNEDPVLMDDTAIPNFVRLNILEGDEEYTLNAAKNIVLELPSISRQQRLQQNNRTGFYWQVVGQELIVPGAQKA